MVAKMLSLRSRLLGAMTKYAPLVIGVMELGAAGIIPQPTKPFRFQIAKRSMPKASRYRLMDLTVYGRQEYVGGLAARLATTVHLHAN